MMKEFKVYGSGCPKCHKTADMIQAEADRRGVEIALIKIFDPEEIAKAGLMRTPGVRLNGKFVHAGGVPEEDVVRKWFD